MHNYKGVAAILAASALTLAGCSGRQSGDVATATPTTTTSSEAASATAQPSSVSAEKLDVQAHRGGRGEYTEESLPAFEKALALGVDTLEFDIVMSKDGVPVVWHDPRVEAEKCSDTAPVHEGDEQFPYVGKLLHELTYEQLQTLNCNKKLENFPDAQHADENHMLKLSDVFELAAQHGPDVLYNIETKIEGEHREESAEPQEFVDAIISEAEKFGVLDKITIQSFDWRSLELVKQQHPDVITVALYDETTWVPNSPWLGSVNYDEVNGDALEGVKKLGADVVSPGYAVPYGPKAGDPDFAPTADKEYVKRAHDMGLKVVPWTVNDEATMRHQIEAGVDGIISDYPTMLAKIASEYGWEKKLDKRS